MQFAFILSLIFAIIIAVFALLNGDKVTVDFVFAEIEVSQAIVIFVSAALGAIIVTILGLIRQVKLSLKIKEQTKKISSLENEKLAMEGKINEMINKSIVTSDKITEVKLDNSISKNKEFTEIEKNNSSESSVLENINGNEENDTIR